MLARWTVVVGLLFTTIACSADDGAVDSPGEPNSAANKPDGGQLAPRVEATLALLAMRDYVPPALVSDDVRLLHDELRVTSSRVFEPIPVSLRSVDQSGKIAVVFSRGGRPDDHIIEIMKLRDSVQLKMRHRADYPEHEAVLVQEQSRVYTDGSRLYFDLFATWPYLLDQAERWQGSFEF